jgi:hypothetical protein
VLVPYKKIQREKTYPSDVIVKHSDNCAGFKVINLLFLKTSKEQYIHSEAALRFKPELT